MIASGKFLQRVVVLGAVLLPAAMSNGTEEPSVFDRPAPATAQPANSSDGDLGALQLSGISTLGGQSMFNFVDARNNRSFWVPLNGTTNGFSVTAYDAATETVVVGRNGQSRPIKLRQAKIAALPGPVGAAPNVQVPARPPGSPPPAVIRTADGGEIVNPKTPQEIAQAEMEARMMVSDLLEISMQERARQKALREAQQKQPQGAPPAAPQAAGP